MKRLILLVSSLAIGASAFAAPAGAHETDPCWGHDYGNHGQDVWVFGAVGVISVGGVFYIDDRNYLNGNGLWIYLESNGEGGLQRGGYSYVRDGWDPCLETTNPDTIIF